MHKSALPYIFSDYGLLLSLICSRFKAGFILRIACFIGSGTATFRAQGTRRVVLSIPEEDVAKKRTRYEFASSPVIEELDFRL